jgi:hypothetical protein
MYDYKYHIPGFGLILSISQAATTLEATVIFYELSYLTFRKTK